MRRSGMILLTLAGAALTFAAPERPRPAAPDLLFFTKEVAGDLHARCAGCHCDPESGGRYHLRPLDDAPRPARESVLANYRATLALLDAESPAESLLLRKALGEASHAGGAIYTSRTSKDFLNLLHFAMGATLDNRPPAAIVQKRYETGVGQDLQIDGTLSGDPDGNPLTYRWRLTDKPAGSRARVGGAETDTARLRPDRRGSYRLELVVGDGKLWSLPAGLMVVAKPAPTATRPPASGPSANKTPSAPRKSILERRLDPLRLKLIRRVYFDLKWRTPRLAEIERWYDRSHGDMVKAFLEDEETWDTWFEQQLFYFLLVDRFRPKEGQVTTIPARLTRGEITMERAIEEIVRSQYFNARNPGNDTFVTVVLEQCLGMVVQERRNTRILETGKKMYDGYRAKLFKETGDSQADFVRIVFRQRAFLDHLVGRTWKALHGADLEKKRRKAFVDRCVDRPGTFRELYGEWLTGAEYVEGVTRPRKKGEIPYVRSLFLDTLDRLPSYQELRNVRNAFLSLADPTPIRLVMGRVLLESDQARIPGSALLVKPFVLELFLRLFARQPTDKELTTFVNALKNDPAVTPRVVLYTLISSPEYQAY